MPGSERLIGEVFLAEIPLARFRFAIALRGRNTGKSFLENLVWPGIEPGPLSIKGEYATSALLGVSVYLCSVIKIKTCSIFVFLAISQQVKDF